MRGVLSGFTSLAITKLFGLTNTASALVSVLIASKNFLDAYEQSILASTLNSGQATLNALNSQYTNPEWLEIEVEFGFLEYVMSNGSTIRYIVGNTNNPSAAYRVTAVRTSTGWIPM